MATNTTKFSLRKPAGTDTVNVTTDISDNMDKIDAAIPKLVASPLVATSENRTNGAYGDLATTTDTVDATVGASGKVKVTFTCHLTQAGGVGESHASFAMSGANTQAGTDAYSIMVGVANDRVGASNTILLSGLTPGVTTFKMKYRATGTGGCNFEQRQIMVETIV